MKDHGCLVVTIITLLVWVSAGTAINKYRIAHDAQFVRIAEKHVANARVWDITPAINLTGWKRALLVQEDKREAGGLPTSVRIVTTSGKDDIRQLARDDGFPMIRTVSYFKGVKRANIVANNGEPSHITTNTTGGKTIISLHYFSR